MISLSSLGIEEIEPNVCHDTSTNRNILRNKDIAFASTSPGYLEIFDDKDSKYAAMHERNKIILANPRDAWGDYLPFTDLPLDYMETAPAWMQRRLNEYNDAVERGVPEHKLPDIPTRCRRRRADGSRCWAWSWGKSSEGYCRYHAPAGSFDYGAQFQKMTDAAKARLMTMQSSALDALEEMVEDRDMVPHVRLKAAENILDRTGLAAKQELQISGSVQHEVIDPAQAVRDRLQALSERLTPAELPSSTEPEPIIIEAEIVEDNNDN